jgi:two-component system, NarL family, response regulator NreC
VEEDGRGMVTIIIADDHPVVRQGLSAVISLQPDYQVVGEAGDGLDALSLVASLRPDVLVVDLMMPTLGGLEVVRQVTARYPATHSVVLSMHSNEAYVLEALRNGALGYVLKDSPASDLMQAIDCVSRGERFLSAPLNQKAMDAYGRLAEGQPSDPYDSLSAREREVFQMMAEGLSASTIAGRMVISKRTVDTHREHILNKLGLHGQTQVVRYALRRGIIALDE